MSLVPINQLGRGENYLINLVEIISYLHGSTINLAYYFIICTKANSMLNNDLNVRSNFSVNIK